MTNPTAHTAHTGHHHHGAHTHHAHSHPVSHNRAFAIGISLNVIFVLVEAGYGIKVNSLALIADAWHNLSDVLSLLLAWGAAYLATKSGGDRRTYGFRKVTIMASTVSAMMLLIALGGITWEAIERFFNPTSVAGYTVIIVAAIGVVINTLTALLFMSGQKDDLNIRAAFLHMAVDALVSVGVVIAGFIILYTGLPWIDPVISLIIVAVIVVGTWSLLRDSIDLAIDSVPAGVDIESIKEYLSGAVNVEQLHDLHVWPLSTTEVALTVHLIMTDSAETKRNSEILHEIHTELRDHFHIKHATIQIESSGDTPCHLDRAVCL